MLNSKASFSQCWRMWGVGVRQRAGDEKGGKCGREVEKQKDGERVRDGAGDRHRDARETVRERWRSWEKMWFGLVFWAACSICPPWQRGRVTGNGRNWISRLNTPSSSSSLFPSPLPCSLSPSLPLFSPLYLFSCSIDGGNVVEIAGRDVLAKCS